MSSFVYLELDRTAPTIEIIAPVYTTNDLITPITVRANEELGHYQEFYAVDSQGNREDFTFSHIGREFVGNVKLETLQGTVHFYAVVKDTVDNASELALKDFIILEDIGIHVYSTHRALGLNMKDSGYVVKTQDKRYNINTTDRSRRIVSDDRELETDEEDLLS